MKKNSSLWHKILFVGLVTTIVMVISINLLVSLIWIKKPLVKQAAFLFNIVIDYNSNAFLTSLFINNSVGFSSASLTATKKPTDSLPSIILWS